MTDHDPALEERARTLLTLAADTVPASSLTVDPPPRRPVWPLLAAAAAVVLVVVGGALLLPGDDGRQPAPTPPGTVQVPQTLWMTQEQARQTLATAGLEVQVAYDNLNECDYPEDRVLSSRPTPSRTVARGSTVRLLLSSPARDSTAFCVGFPRFEDALGLLDLARFDTTGLKFAPEVEVYVDGELTRTLTAMAAPDPESWGERSPLTMLVDRLGDINEVGGQLRSPELRTSVARPGERGCGVVGDPPRALTDRPSTVIEVLPVVPEAVGYFSCHRVRVYRDSQGRVDAVAAVLTTELAEPDAPAEPKPEQRAVAEQFAAYARGGPAPAFATTVELLLGNDVVAYADDVEWGPREMWRLRCRGYAERSCPIDVLDHVASTKPAITSTVEREHRQCGSVFGPLPPELGEPEALRHSVSLSVPEPASCIDAWEVQLWYDDQRRIYAANLILGIP